MDLESAEVLARTMHPAPFEVISFHCQQSAEKDLKGFINWYNKDHLNSMI
jgi:hypothetical protein